MFRKLTVLFALALLLAPIAQAQTVDEILAKHHEAMGGIEKLKALNSMRVTGTIGVGPGMEAPFTMERKRPGKSRMEFSVQGMTGIQAFDGVKTWSVMPFMGQKDPEFGSDEENKAAQEDADFDGALVDYKAKGHTVELMGKESVDGAEAFKLKVTKKNGNIEFHYLDAETYLLMKQEAKVKRRGTEMDGETTFSDYKDVGGYMQPYSMESGAKGSPQKQKMTFSKIELNLALDDARFNMPATADSSAKAAPKADGDKDAEKKDGDMKADAKADARAVPGKATTSKTTTVKKKKK